MRPPGRHRRPRRLDGAAADAPGRCQRHAAAGDGGLGVEEALGHLLAMLWEVPACAEVSPATRLDAIEGFASPSSLDIAPVLLALDIILGVDIPDAYLARRDWTLQEFAVACARLPRDGNPLRHYQRLKGLHVSWQQIWKDIEQTVKKGGASGPPSVCP